jgi:hypothetical protein
MAYGSAQRLSGANDNVKMTHAESKAYTKQVNTPPKAEAQLKQQGAKMAKAILSKVNNADD